MNDVPENNDRVPVSVEKSFRLSNDHEIHFSVDFPEGSYKDMNGQNMKELKKCFSELYGKIVIEIARNHSRNGESG